MLVDLLTHIWDSPAQLGPAAAARLRERGGAPWDRPLAAPDNHDEAMAGVDVALVHGLVSQRLGAAITIEQVARHVARRPDRLLGLASIDPTVDDFLARLDDAQRLGLKGLSLSPAAQAFHPCHSQAMQLLERCAAWGWPVYVRWGLGLAAESSMELAQPMLWDEVARALPSLRLCLGQMGEPWAEQTLELLAKHEGVYADLSGLARRPWALYNVLVAAKERGVLDKLLWGSGYPWGTPGAMVEAIQSANRAVEGTALPKVPVDNLQAIVTRDALACLGLAAPAPTNTRP